MLEALHYIIAFNLFKCFSYSVKTWNVFNFVQVLNLLNCYQVC